MSPQVPAHHEITITVNGVEHTLHVPPHRTLIEMLREDLNLTGTTEGCGFGVCGSCTVLIDNKPVSSCLELAVNVNGQSIETIEGLTHPTDNDALHPLQAAFLREDGYQCGYCTPGILMTTRALLRDHPNPSREELTEYLSENICRCTGYVDIIRSVETAISMGEHTE